MPMPLQNNRRLVSEIETGQLPAQGLDQDLAAVETREVEVEMVAVEVGGGEKWEP